MDSVRQLCRMYEAGAITPYRLFSRVVEEELAEAFMQVAEEGLVAMFLCEYPRFTGYLEERRSA